MSKRSKRVLVITLMLAIVIVTTLFTLKHTYISEKCFEFDKATGTITDYDTHTIISYFLCSNDIQIPKEIDGVPVTRIGRLTFYGPDLVSISIYIPETVETIEDGAFWHNQLEEVTVDEKNDHFKVEKNALLSKDGTQFIKIIGKHTEYQIPDGVTSIGEGAFEDNLLNTIKLPDSVESIGHMALEGNQLTEIDLPENVKSIGAGAFANNQLTEIIIPDRVETIDARAFTYNQITNVVIPESVETLGPDAFGKNIKTVVIEGNSLRFNDNWEKIGFPEELKPTE